MVALRLFKPLCAAYFCIIASKVVKVKSYCDFFMKFANTFDSPLLSESFLL